jgi:hypothetical protein
MNQRIVKVGRLGVVATQTEKLPYSIELWDDGADTLERVLARFRPPRRSILKGEYCCVEEAGQSRIPPTRMAMD